MWLVDPITKEPSVALTLVVIATVCMIAGIAVEFFTPFRSTHLLDEFFGAAMTLYGGHMVVNKPQQIFLDDNSRNSSAGITAK